MIRLEQAQSNTHTRRVLVVSLEHRFFESNGIPVTRLAFSYEYWARYLSEFDRVMVLARLCPNSLETEYEEIAVTGPGVEFINMPYYVGPVGFMRNLPASLKVAWKAARLHEHFLLRSGNISNLTWICLTLLRKHYIREFPGNTREGILGFTGDSGILMRAIANGSHWLARLQARRAAACSYVSQALRRSYPARSSDREFVFSSVHLVDTVTPRTHQKPGSIFRIISVGRMEKEKGHNVLIQAIAQLPKEVGDSVEVNFVGEGSQRADLQRLAAEAGLNVVFYGAVLEKDRLFTLVRESNLFVLPSFTEGMPRALIEAMSLKVPCLASGVGGVVEVTDRRFIVPPGDVKALAASIAQLFKSEDLREENAAVHCDTVKALFASEVTQATMHSFWRFS